jgi:heme/copper-type cytochrome/quinol oxidase subunit 2
MLFITGCAAGEDSAESTSAPTSSPAATSSAATSPGTSPAVDALRPVRIDVAQTDGIVTPPPSRVEVPLGSTVVLRVGSDVADQVHVHGYELEQDVAAGSTTTFEFTADQSGLFEVETHETALLLLQLQVA